MNRKAQIGIGGLIIVAIVVIVGLVLMVASAQNIDTYRNTYDVVNQSTVATNGTTGLLDTDCQAWNSVVVYNGSDDVIIEATNYSVTNYFVSDGALVTRFNVTSGPLYQAQPWNASFTCEPYGYDTSSGGRAISGLIILFFALAVAMVAIVLVLKSELLKGMRN